MKIVTRNDIKDKQGRSVVPYAVPELGEDAGVNILILTAGRALALTRFNRKEAGAHDESILRWLQVTLANPDGTLMYEFADDDTEDAQQKNNTVRKQIAAEWDWPVARKICDKAIEINGMAPPKEEKEAEPVKPAEPLKGIDDLLAEAREEKAREDAKGGNAQAG